MANFNLNKVVLGGRLTSEPELKTTPSGVSVISFTVAVNRRFSKDGETQADFIRVTAWRQTAEFVSKFFHKGSSICITGSIQTRSWTDNNGTKRYETEVVADEAIFVDSKSESSAQVQKNNNAYVPESYGNIGGSTEGSFQNEAAEKLEQFEDDELPF
jgi:single-strand DNA-binding protein